MTDHTTNLSYGYGVSPQQRNRVMRNTYWLLSLSLVPTVLGAWFGLASGAGNLFGGGLGMLLALGVMFGFIFAIERTKNSTVGVPVLLGFTFFMGVLMSRLIGYTLGFRNGPELIMTAFGGTAGVFFLMASLSTVIKRDLSSMAKWLMVGVMVILVASVINVFVGSSIAMLVISTLSIAIFSGLMLFDLKRIVDGGETNYISATLALYLDIVNIFQNLLFLLTSLAGDRD